MKKGEASGYSGVHPSHSLDLVSFVMFAKPFSLILDLPERKKICIKQNTGWLTIGIHLEPILFLSLHTNPWDRC